MQIEAYRQQAESFLADLNRELAQFYSGQKTDFEVAGIYGDYSDLYSPETLGEISAQLDAISESFPSRRKSLERLRAFAVEQFLDSRASTFAQQLAGEEVSRTFSWDDREVPIVRLPLLQAAEPDCTRRRKLEDIRVRHVAETRSGITALVEELHAAATRLGFPQALDAFQAGSGIDYRGLSATVELLLAVTEPEYLDRFAESFGMTPGLSAAEMRYSDIAYWELRNEPQGFFRDDLLTSALDETFSMLDLRPEIPDAISLDLDTRPRQVVSALCLPIHIPNEVKIIAFRRGGQHDYAALLHQNGHAHHFAWTSPSLPAEFRLIGDRGLCETYAFLFEQLVWNESWLSEHLAFMRPDQYLRFQALWHCYVIRREIGEFRFELGLYGEPAAAADSGRYSGIMMQHTGVIHETESWFEVDRFRSADHLRGRIFSAMLDEHLMAKFGSNWHRRKAAGNFLKEIWETGRLYTADELSREIGLGPLDPHILAGRLQRELRQ